MSEGRVKSVRQVQLGRCADCGTLHTNVGAGGFCYLCQGRVFLVGTGDVQVVDAEPCSRALINELYARREMG